MQTSNQDFKSFPSKDGVRNFKGNKLGRPKDRGVKKNENGHQVGKSNLRSDQSRGRVIGKSYRSRSDREPKERSLSDKKIMEKRFSHDTKVGGRNRTSAFYMRNMTRR